MAGVTLKKRTVEADVLIIGGGIAGLMSAIRAAELGAKVVVAEKANTEFSGAGATGNDHFMCYIPEAHGPDVEPIVDDFQLGQQGGLRKRSFIRTWLLRSEEIIKLWDAWGIPMKYNGKYEYAGHAFPGQPIHHIHYAGKDQKTIMTREALKRGAEIVNRVMCFDLLTDDEGVIGAVGIDTREDVLVTFRAKAVIMSTGAVQRLYPASSTPAWMFNTRLSPTCVGDGRAMAYRAGAEMVSMEIPVFRCGPVYFARAGKGTWAGVLRDPQGKPVGPFVTEPDNTYGDPVVDVYQDVFMEFKKSGRGPVYMDCKGLSDDELGYMYHWLRNEGNVALLDNLEQEGIDPREKPVEFRSYHYELFPRGGVYYDETGTTSLKGLYAAGDEIFGGISGAAVFGWIAGETATETAKDAVVRSIDSAKTQIEEAKARVEAIRNRKVGATWKEANICLQQIMFDFTGEVRSETLLDAGLFALRRLKQKVHHTLISENQHDLCRSLEVINLLDVGELIIITARERKETRGKHKRPDYPFTNPQLAKVIVAKKVNGEPVLEWRSLKE